MSPLVKRVLTTLALIGVVIVLENRSVGLERIVPDTAWRQLAMFAMVNVVVALSLNVINGMAGQFSIGHAGFDGVGAYTAAVVSGHLHAKLGTEDPTFTNSFIVMPVSILAAAAMAALFGLV